MNKSLSIREVVHNINEKYGNNTVFSAKDLVKTSKETKKTNIFKSFYSINVNEYMEKKNGLSYISWTYAWAEAKKKFPNITYKVHRFGEKQLPYVFDENTGYMVSTEITIDDLTHSMWLPVMDGSNKAMKNKPYTYDSKFKKGLVVEAASMFDINKAIMRCLVKNLAMFGLGLYVYAGEDLPESDNEALDLLKLEIGKFKGQEKKIKERILSLYKVKNLSDLSEEQISDAISKLKSFREGE